MSKLTSATVEFDYNKSRAENCLSKGQYILAYRHYNKCLTYSKKTTKKHKEIQECINDLIDSLRASNLHPYLEELNQLINMKQL